MYRLQDYEGEGQSALFQPVRETSQSGPALQGGYYGASDAQPMISHAANYVSSYATNFAEPGVSMTALDQPAYGIEDYKQKVKPLLPSLELHPLPDCQKAW